MNTNQTKAADSVRWSEWVGDWKRRMAEAEARKKRHHEAFNAFGYNCACADIAALNREYEAAKSPTTSAQSREALTVAKSSDKNTP